jgi:catechol 2,3-dioxygenase-like lactoylglutathione lyase family enzyme
VVTAISAIVQSTTRRADVVRFYREALALGEPDHTQGRDFFMVGDVHLAVDAGDPRLRGPLPRLGLFFVVDDLEAQVTHMKEAGVSFDVEPSQDRSGTRLAVCRDPDGNYVTLMSGPRRPRGRQLALKALKGRGKPEAKRKPAKKPVASGRKKSAKKTEKKKKKR